MKVKKWYEGYYTTRNNKRVWVNGYYKNVEIIFPIFETSKDDKNKMNNKNIKNLHIKHLEDFNNIGYYLCNLAVGLGYKEKLVKDLKDVTCKNCLSIIKHEFSIEKFIKLKKENFFLKNALRNLKIDIDLNRKEKLLNHLDSLKNMIDEYPF